MTTVKRLFDILYYQKENFPQEKAFNHKIDGKWSTHSTEEAVEIVNKLSSGLLDLGVQKEDKVAVVSYINRMEWIFVDLALQQIGAISVPVYPTISSKDYTYIFNEAEVVYAFVGGGDLYEKVAATKASTPSLKEIYTFDEVEGRKYWATILSDNQSEQVNAIKATIGENDLATIIYTSGTTGLPKGVMLTHKNIISNANGVKQHYYLDVGSRSLSFLPLCHIFERTSTYFQMYSGCNIYYTGTKELGGDDGDIKTVRPHFFDTVPRLLEKVYEKIYARGEELSGIKRSLFFWALKLTDDYEYDKEFKGLEKIKWRIADSLIFSKWREALGGNIKVIVSGAAALPEKVARVFSAAGIPIREAYGLTEASPGIAGGTPEKLWAKIGTVGPAFPEVEILIDTDEGEYKPGEGEILAHGPNIMMGYYKQPEKTAAVFKDIDGKRYLRTGDIGKMVIGPNGDPFLKITDRKKELLKTSGGKYVAPAPIESRFKEEFIVEQIMVVGEKRKFVSALIVPSDEVLQNYCERNELPFNSMEEAIQHPKVVQEFEEIVERVNKEFSKIEQIKKFTLLPKEWLAIREDGTDAELTPTLKLKRRVIRKKFGEAIEEMYS